MFSQIAAIRSSFPSAFSALGIGSIGLIGQLPFGLASRQIIPSMKAALPIEYPDYVATVLPYVAAFAIFFYTYALGFATIAVAERFRGGNPKNDAQGLAAIFNCKNEAVIKFCLEQRSLVETFNGLGLAVVVSGLSIAAALLLFGSNAEWIALFVLLFSLGFMLAVWREANFRSSLIASLIDELNFGEAEK